MMKFGNLYDFCTGASRYIRLTNVTWDYIIYMKTLPKAEHKISLKWYDKLDDRGFYFRIFGNVLA